MNFTNLIDAYYSKTPTVVLLDTSLPRTLTLTRTNLSRAVTVPRLPIVLKAPSTETIATRAMEIMMPRMRAGTTARGPKRGVFDLMTMTTSQIATTKTVTLAPTAANAVQHARHSMMTTIRLLQGIWSY